MKNNSKFLLIISLFFLILAPQFAFSQGLSSNELLIHAKQYDGKLITYSGEVIGDIMLRGEFAWVNINDGDNAVGVWMKASLAKEINFTGSYKTQGDKVEVAGIFHRACLEHGGDLDIHAQSLRKLENGRTVNQVLSLDKKNLSLILLGALFLLWILTLFRRK